ncbi:MAG: SsrA-binding protein [Elusimicrobia bacterium RIFOXYA1_FULL_47_7]|nr:MAG: SsrA-binding protein [Elusimicrobia bacterium RIFOXYA12_FULL_49_49]OGS08001.1 MAG: SsrA-binding protein [Elusimicrobia bacterium RIFOXYA1_FULL_47_7]OGS11326.1 MAG: SsrA-binding protein [Elusimicrobia bacterium RIFOXYB1_FULL_48_9]OGS16657.1 MAG: SsrA-binding protein [Elusimicrobia bacterium RIFOXYA2_FULL_47_53]OGS25506.1 MAG: SsrA-binding protein [Elusimicrobia bacterium RIFOXYB12_FULL_50_12]OGS31635.1 MAG: SsrA-binding protein [Elusimicrobia bacterium RIFOXYB2_FULL_46_23]
MEIKTAATNRKAYHNYEILEKFEAGLVLSGYEVKSLRESQANLTDGLVLFRNGQAYLENIHISPYKQQSTHVLDYSPTRPRKLLMHRSEINRFDSRVKEKGLAMVPLELYFNGKGLAKVLLGLGRGKRTADKRESIKKRETEREIRKEFAARQKGR